MSAVLESKIIRVKEDPVGLLEQSLREKWGDGFPLIPATDERVEKMLQGTPLLSTDVVMAEVPPSGGRATVEMVAINAVMAGCEPKHLPVLIAALQAMTEPAYNSFALGTTTAPVISMLVVNGPTRDDMEINYRASCLGGAAGRGTTTIGRALQLCLRNIGGMRAGNTSQTVIGQPARVTGVCIGEWEERTDWPSLAMRRGFKRDEEVVTVYANNGNVPLADMSTPNDRDLAYLLAKCIAMPLSNLYTNMMFRGEVIIIINPMWAERFERTFPKIESFQECLYDNAWQPIEFWPKANQEYLRNLDRVDSRGRVYATIGPDRIQPIVCGGLGNFHATILPAWGESEMQSRATIRA